MHTHDSSTPANVMILAVGPVPPPVTGLTTVQSQMSQSLSKMGEFRTASFSRPGRGMARFLPWRIVRALGYVRAISLLAVRRFNRPVAIYFPVNTRWALIWDAALCTIARMRKYRVILHHHSYSYLDRESLPFRMFKKTIPSGSVHLALCDPMADLLKEKVRNGRAIVIPNVPSNDALDSPPKVQHTPFTLGFIGNITISKGIDLAIETYEMLQELSVPVRLVVAGPLEGAEERTLIARAQSKNGDSVKYIGPVYGADKDSFFADIDALLFPTKYRVEAQPLVIEEAMRAAVPVLCTARGCIRSMVADEAGLVVERPQDFPREASQRVTLWIGSTEQWTAASDASTRASVLHSERHNDGLAELERWLSATDEAASQTSARPRR